MIEFTYTNLKPHAARDQEPNTNTNVVRVWWDGGVLKYDRRYVSVDGTVSETAIEHTFSNKPNKREVASMIHWGCCGWSANDHQLAQLYELIGDFVG